MPNASRPTRVVRAYELTRGMTPTPNSMGSPPGSGTAEIAYVDWAETTVRIVFMDGREIPLPRTQAVRIYA